MPALVVPDNPRALIKNPDRYEPALNPAIAELLVELSARPFKKLDGNRRDWFETIDRPALMPLPEQPFEIARFQVCRVNIDCHVDIDRHNYTVAEHMPAAHRAHLEWTTGRFGRWGDGGSTSATKRRSAAQLQAT